MNPQYETLAKCLLPEHMLEWFELTNVEVKPKEKKSTRDKQPDDIPVNVIHLYLDENELTPDNREDLRPNGFTPAKTFHDFPIRGQRVMLDFDLAMLYEVETRSLNQTVKRNARRFPDDFMFQLTEQEWILISSQFVTTSRMKRPKKSLL